MKKYHFILFVLLGLFLLPNDAIACGTAKNCCVKEISKVKTEKKSCCESEKKTNKDHKGCKGNCGHSKCGCSSTCPSSSVSFLAEIDFKTSFFSYLFLAKKKFLFSSPSISDGFYSIWLIPKIS